MKIKRFNQILESNHFKMIDNYITNFDILLQNIEKYLMIEFKLTRDEYISARNIYYDEDTNKLFIIFDDENGGTGQEYEIEDLDSFIKILNENGYSKSLNDILNIIENYKNLLAKVEDYMKFKDKNIGDIFGITRVYKTTGMEKLLINYDIVFSYDIEEYVDINDLIKFIDNPELYKKSKTYNL